MTTKAAGFADTGLGPRQAGAIQPKARVTVSPDVDKTIALNLESAFEGNNLHVSYEVANRVVTLTGDVNSLSRRARAEKIAAAVVNVQEVVNELGVRPRQFRPSKKEILRNREGQVSRR